MCADASSLAQIAKLVEESTQGGQNRAFVIGSEPPSQHFYYYDWNEFLSTYYKHIPQITSYHHFYFSKEYPGKVVLPEFADSEEIMMDVLKQGVNIDPTALPCTLSSSGLSEQRKQYLTMKYEPFVMKSIKISLAQNHLESIQLLTHLIVLAHLQRSISVFDLIVEIQVTQRHVKVR